MSDKKTVFVLGAGASCPYGYPSGAHLRERICLDSTDTSQLTEVLKDVREDIIRFKQVFERSSTKSIDLFIARNPQMAQVGKYIIAFETFRSEQRSQFREEAEWAQEAIRKHHQNRAERKDYLAKKDFQGNDWYSFFFDRLTSGLVARDNLPDFSDGKVAFVTFNYDRSLEHFFYDSFSNSFTEVPGTKVIGCLKELRILHVYGQIAPLKWQDDKAGVDYKPQEISEPLLKKAAANIKTIYEQKGSPELAEARELLARAEQIFFLGFGYAIENMDVLGLPTVIPSQCQVYGTAYGLIKEEVERIHASVHNPRHVDQKYTMIESDNTVDCLMLLRKYF